MTQSSPKVSRDSLGKVLITGANGFVGTELVARYAARGIDMVTIGRQPVSTGKNVPFVQAHLGQPGELVRALAAPECRGVETIIHIAVSRHHREFPDRALDMFYVNTAAAAELLDFAQKTGVKRAMFGSTGTVYSTKALSDDDSTGNLESEFNKPGSYFAASKLFADALCDLYRGYFPIGTLRLYAPYGPGLTGRLLTDLVDRVREGRPLSLPAKGPGLGFAALYIDDVLDAIDASLAGGWNETVNVACPESLTVEDTGRLIGRILGKEPVFERSTAPGAPKVEPNVDRMKQLMPGHSFTGIEAGLRKMIAAANAG